MGARDMEPLRLCDARWLCDVRRLFRLWEPKRLPEDVKLASECHGCRGGADRAAGGARAGPPPDLGLRRIWSVVAARLSGAATLGRSSPRSPALMTRHFSPSSAAAAKACVLAVGRRFDPALEGFLAAAPDAGSSATALRPSAAATTEGPAGASAPKWVLDSAGPSLPRKPATSAPAASAQSSSSSSAYAMVSIGTRGTTAVRRTGDDGDPEPQFRRAHCQPPAPPPESLPWTSSGCAGEEGVHCAVNGGRLGREDDRESSSSNSRPVGRA
mmetsp:Transcript_79159/g.171079  ORF Transcript_79159/g.171079 Transcript_79159/m.171079 type:complete len:271 (+) Transcript_79159:178-990(+)